MYNKQNSNIMSLKLFIIPLTTLYLVFQLHQTNATFLVESATGKALIQSACSASDSPPACYAVLNPVANNPNLNPTDICTVALQAAANVAKITHNMLNMSASVATSVARDPSVRQSILLCSQEYGQVLDLVEKAATSLAQKVNVERVPDFLSTAIAAIAKCDASAIKVAHSAVQISNKNVDCSKMLKNALGIYKVFAEFIENPSHDPKAITGTGSGDIGGNFDFNAGGSAGGVDGGSAGGSDGGIIGLSAPTRSPIPEDDASGGTTSNNNNRHFSFAKRGEFRKEFLPNGNVQTQGSLDTDSDDGSGNKHSHISTEMKFEGLGLGFGQRIRGFLHHDSENTDSGSSAGTVPESGSSAVEPQSGSSAGEPQSASSAEAPQTGSTPSPISTNMKFEGLGLGFGQRIKGFLNHDSESSADASQSGSSADASQSGSVAGEPQSGSTPGLGFGQRIKGLFHPDSENTNGESSADASQSGSSAAEPESGSAPSPISTNLKFEGLGLRQRFKGLFHHDSENTGSGSSADTTPQSGSSAGAPQSRSSAGAPQSGDAPSQISTNMKFEGLGLGFGKRIKGLFHHDFENTNSGSSADTVPQSGSSADTVPQSGSSADTVPQSGSTAGAPETASTPSQIDTNMKFEGLGLGFGKRIRGFFHHDSDTDIGSSAGTVPQSVSSGDASQSGSSADAPQSGSSAASPVNAGLKFSLSGFAKSFTSSKKHKESGKSPSPAKAPSSSTSSAKAPTPDSPSPAPSGKKLHADASDDGVNSYSDDDVTNETIDSPTPSPSGNNANEVSLKYSLSHLIPDI